VQKSREAVVDGLAAYRSITSGISDKPNPLALYIPYSDFIVERWSNYFLPGLDAFRALGVPLDILPYAPPMEESVYPYYPIHHNKDVLERLLREKTVLVLTNVSGFQQTDSDLIREFVARGGVVVAFGEQIPMGRSYERKEIFGVDEAPAVSSHTGIVIKEALGRRVSTGKRFALRGLQLPSWMAAGGARVIAAFEDNSPAVTVNKYGKGTVITILADAPTAAQNMPELVRDALDYALSASGNDLSVDIVGTNEATDVAVKKTSDGFRVVVVNHQPNEREVILRPVRSGTETKSEWVDLVSGQKMIKTGADFSLKLKITGGGFRSLEFRRSSAY
jgi:hypothetical protein